MSLADPILIAEAFNEHFARIGKTLINKFNVDHDSTYLSYLKHSCPSSLHLYPTTPAEIFRLVTSGVATQYAALGFLHEMPSLTLS